MANKSKTKEKEVLKLAQAEVYMSALSSVNPWKETKTEFEEKTTYEDFVETTNLCRFFYKTEPVVATVINKLVEIGVNDIIISKKGLTDNEFRVFMALKPRLLEFTESLAQELLLSGLVVPEISYGPVDKDTIFELGIKKYNRLIFPVSMWIRDPKSIKINSSVMSDTPSYYVVIPGDVIYFIQNAGKYSDGREDLELFKELKTYFPDFVKRVTAGETEFLIEDSKLVLRRKYLSDDPYPISYVAPVLDALQHKRELRRMDYTIIDKVIGAIMHVKMGSDTFPVTDTDEDKASVLELKKQLSYRFNSTQNLERIFQLITNHTVEIAWVFPDTEALLDMNKYDDINQEILFGLGFPRVLITGEAAKTGTSDPELAMIAPVKTMESIRRKIIKIIKDICKQVAQENNFKVPEVKFKALNLHAFKDFIESMDKLYEKSAISRTSYGEVMGFDFNEELDILETENKVMKEKDLPEFGPTPNSRLPDNQNNTQTQSKPVEKTEKPVKTTQV
jgi:hypothetical protein